VEPCETRSNEGDTKAHETNCDGKLSILVFGQDKYENKSSLTLHLNDIARYNTTVEIRIDLRCIGYRRCSNGQRLQ
jgi:hypothetical protein